MLFRNGMNSLLEVFLEVIKQLCINCRVSFKSITLYNNCDQKRSDFIRSILRMKFIISTRFGGALDFKQCCMKISFFSHYWLKLSSLFRKKIFCGIQTYSCDKIHLIQWYNNEDGEKSVWGVKGTKNKRFPPKERALASSIPSSFLYGAMWNEPCWKNT